MLIDRHVPSYIVVGQEKWLYIITGTLSIFSSLSILPSNESKCQIKLDNEEIELLTYLREMNDIWGIKSIPRMQLNLKTELKLPNQLDKSETEDNEIRAPSNGSKHTLNLILDSQNTHSQLIRAFT